MKRERALYYLNHRQSLEINEVKKIMTGLRRETEDNKSDKAYKQCLEIIDKLSDLENLIWEEYDKLNKGK